jgi:hypothetical protein
MRVRPIPSKKRLAVIGCASTLALCVGGVGAANASAAYVSSSSGGANLRTCASTSCLAVDYWYNGHPLSVLCWVDAGWANANGGGGSGWSNRWFQVAYRTGAYRMVYEMIFSHLVAAQPSVPNCQGYPPPNS